MIEQVLGKEVFLQGKYLSLGLNGSGTLGTKQAAGTGIFTDSANGFIRLGMVGDVDGFGKGAAATREAMLTGTAQEGFSVGYDIGSAHYVRSNAERTAMTQIANGVNTVDAGEGSASVTWAASTAEKVKIEQVMTLADDAKFVRVDVTLTNETGGAVNNVRYMRTIDPDHGPTFSTINTIVEQGKDGSDGALIAAYAAKGQTPLFYYSTDERAVVSTYGLKNFDPYAAQAYDKPQAEGYANPADEAININFAVGTLAAGASTTVTFYFGITDNLSATVAEIKSLEAGADQGRPTPAPEPVNHAPTVANDSASTVATKAVTGNVLANDKDADGDALIATLATGPAHGKVTLAADGSYSYVADKGFVGVDTWTYAASDGKASASGTVAISVAAAPNSTPTVANDSASTVATKAVTGNVLANDKDADGDALIATLATGPAHGKVTLAADGSYSYVADKGFVGTDSFTYAASDGKASASGTVAISVAPAPNSTPTVANDSASTVATKAVTGNVLANDKDADGDALIATLATGPAHGKVTLAADGSYSYVADKGFVGTDSFTYAASDGEASASGTVAISVAPAPNSTPTVANDSASTVATKAVTGNVLANDKDADGDALIATLATGPAHGKVTLAADGSYSYVADKGFVGTDSFTYAASDGEASVNAEVAVTVDAAPAPLAPGGVLGRALLQNGSSAANQVMTATSGHDVFFFDNSAASGVDTISGFNRGDLVGLKNAFFDGNNDGIITLSKNAVALQSPVGGNALRMAGVSSLRLMGTDEDGTFVYASGAGRPKGAQEGKIGDNKLAGDATDKKTQVFFFDTGLGLDLGHDTIANFGKKDVLVTTLALQLDGAGHVARDLDGSIGLLGADGSDALGHVDALAIGGSAAGAMEFDGALIRDGATYYVYSLAGSAVGIEAVVI